RLEARVVLPVEGRFRVALDRDQLGAVLVVRRASELPRDQAGALRDEEYRVHVPGGDEHVAICVHVDRVAVVYVHEVQELGRRGGLAYRIGVVAGPPVPHEVTLRVDFLDGAVGDGGVRPAVLKAGEIDSRQRHIGEQHQVAVRQPEEFVTIQGYAAG